MEIISVRTLIVTYQIKYRDYLRNVQIERAKNKIFSSNDGSKMKLSNNPNDYRRLIKEDVITKEKKVKTQDSNLRLNSRQTKLVIWKVCLQVDLLEFLPTEILKNTVREMLLTSIRSEICKLSIRT